MSQLQINRYNLFWIVEILDFDDPGVACCSLLQLVAYRLSGSWKRDPAKQATRSSQNQDCSNFDKPNALLDLQLEAKSVEEELQARESNGHEGVPNLFAEADCKAERDLQNSQSILQPAKLENGNLSRACSTVGAPKSQKGFEGEDMTLCFALDRIKSAFLIRLQVKALKQPASSLPVSYYTATNDYTNFQKKDF